MGKETQSDYSVHISDKTGGAYANMDDVIKSELDHILNSDSDEKGGYHEGWSERYQSANGNHPDSKK